MHRLCIFKKEVRIYVLSSIIRNSFVLEILRNRHMVAVRYFAKVSYRQRLHSCYGFKQTQKDRLVKLTIKPSGSFQFAAIYD